LIDHVGYLDDVIVRMKKKLGIADARIVTYYQPGRYKGTIYSGANFESARLAGLLTGVSGLDSLGDTPQFMYLWRPF
ncbi:MAG: hypothetical protein PHN75_08510, partial [Syntrophales bacterium]|nr:hypothetical protein [Syntrophales bacterium]